MSEEKRERAMEQAEGMVNTINERLLPGLAAAVTAIEGVQVTADVLKGVQALRDQAAQLSKLVDDLNGSATAIEEAHKQGAVHVVVAKLNDLRSQITGLQLSAEALARHGPRLHEAVTEAMKVEAQIEEAAQAALSLPA